MSAAEDEPTSASASRRVQAILEAAEASAAEIRREAEHDAEALRAQARADAGRASASIEETVRRLQALQGELGALIASLGTGEETPVAAKAPAATEVPAAAEMPAAPTAAEVPEAPGAADDGAGARLIALNMALDGTPREDAARFLAENFSLPDPERLLDEVYASVDG